MIVRDKVAVMNEAAEIAYFLEKFMARKIRNSKVGFDHAETIYLQVHILANLLNNVSLKLEKHNQEILGIDMPQKELLRWLDIITKEYIEIAKL